MMRLEIRRARQSVVDHLARRACGLCAVCERETPGFCIPRPIDALVGEPIADRLERLWRQRVLRWIGEARIASRRGRRVARLVGWLQRVDAEAVGGNGAVVHILRWTRERTCRRRRALR